MAAATDQPGARLVTGPIGPTLRRMTVPMVLGIAAVVTFTLVDTFFISLLGTAPLAAVGFTFPVTLTLTHLAMGLAVGTSAIVGRTLGAEEPDQARRQVADSLLLALAVILALVGLTGAVMAPLFDALGAPAALRPLIGSYMGPWLAGAPLLVLTMVGNSALRASGDTRTPSLIMAGGGLINGLLDPVLIFGPGPLPAFGLQGAALASVAAWVAVLAVNQALLVRHRLVAWYRPRLRPLLAAWRAHLRISVPAAGSNVMPPLANGVLTALVAQHGPAAVAAFGVGIRIEALALVAALAFAGALAPFVSQNFGAGRMDRVTAAYRKGVGFLLGWELAVYALLALPAPVIAALFTDDPAVAAVLVLFLWIRPAGYGFQAALIASSATLNALHKPYHAFTLGLLRLFVFYLPAAYVGGLMAGVPGLFAGATVGSLALGAVAVAWLLRRVLAEPA